MSITRSGETRLQCKAGGCWDYRNFLSYEEENGFDGPDHSANFVHNFIAPMARILLRPNGSESQITTPSDDDSSVLLKQRQIPRASIGQ